MCVTYWLAMASGNLETGGSSGVTNKNEVLDTTFSQQNLDSKLLMVDKKVMSMVSSNENHKQFTQMIGRCM